jgi:predicted N-acetyltransferase YhbS
MLGNSRCYVTTALGDQTVVAFYTLSAVSVERAQVTGRLARNSPDPLPAVLLGRLGVDLAWQGRGLGRLLIRDAVLTTLNAAAFVGVKLIVVDALDDRSSGLYRRAGFRSVSPSGRLLALGLREAEDMLTR